MGTDSNPERDNMDYDANTDDFDSIDWDEYFELYSWIDLDEVEDEA